MLFHIPKVLTPEQVTQARKSLDTAGWLDGKVTAGGAAASVKNNKETPYDHPAVQEVRDFIRLLLDKNKLFQIAAMPGRTSQLMFNRYESGQSYGEHIDNAVLPIPGTDQYLRGDISATLFLADPKEYEGGELTIQDNFGVHSAKLPAGDMVLYPANSLHQVKPVTKGARVACFFWVQSLVREEAKRTLLLDMELAVQRLRNNPANQESVVQLLGVYNNLLRLWMEV